MKLTCKKLRTLLPIRYNKRIYKSGKNVRIDLSDGVGVEKIDEIQSTLEKHNIIMFQDDFVHLPYNFVVEYNF